MVEYIAVDQSRWKGRLRKMSEIKGLIIER